VAGPRFGRFADLVTLRSIRVYGDPSERALEQLRDKARLLGAGEVVLYAAHAGLAGVDHGCRVRHAAESIEA
jgi:hypothetical protein